jgi:hypothetical protein
LKALYGVLRRRWATALPVLLIGLIACMAINQTTKPVYEATGAVLLTSPPTSDAGVKVDSSSYNPYVSFGGLAIAEDILIRRLNDGQTVLHLGREGIRPGYKVMPNIHTNRPIIEVTAEGATAAQATKSVGGLLAELSSQLESLQAKAGVERQYDMSMSAISSSSFATPVNRQRNRRLTIVVVADLISLVGFALLAESVAGRRRHRDGRRQRPAGVHQARADAEADQSVYSSVS